METKNGLHPERGHTVPPLTLGICLARLFLIGSTKLDVSLACLNYHKFQLGTIRMNVVSLNSLVQETKGEHLRMKVLITYFLLPSAY